uniref:limulus clotting factor C n=1 Tax=Ixodes ricinus TaxID=34613 RepID=A0A6B0VD28_IXORI
MTATFNSAWRLILRLLMVVVCVELCSCQKVSYTSNLEDDERDTKEINILRSFNHPDTDKELQERRWKKEKNRNRKFRPTSTFDASKHLKVKAPKIYGAPGKRQKAYTYDGEYGYPGKQPALPVPSPSDSVPKGTEQEKGESPDGAVDVIEVKEPPTTTSTRGSGGDVLNGGSIVIPAVVSGNVNGETKDNIDTASQGNQKANQVQERPKPGSTTDQEVEGESKNIESGKPGLGPHNPLAHVNVTEFIQQNCGKAHSRKRRIVGGTLSSVTTYPWTVGIFTVGSSKPYCGAVLITPWFVLTAAHCTRGRTVVDLRVAYGLQTINERTLAERQEHVAVVKEIHQYEKFKDIVHGDDISLLQLKTPLLADGQPVPPICTPQASQLDRNTVVNTTGVVAGWGRTTYNGESSSDLREVSLPIVSNQECSRVFQDVVKITDGMICAGDITGKKDACQGDSGGPLMWYSSVFERWYVIGVVSFGVKCAEKGYYGTYTWVEKYLSWICEITEGLVCLQKKEPKTTESKPKLVKFKRFKKRKNKNELSPSGLRKSRRRKWNLQHQE